jgi:adenosylcobinamide kinase/adenosylcobinamide-phosphate guanylyltransferase
MNSLALITGGARSGKTELAESLAASFDKPVVYVATMTNPGKGVSSLAEDSALARRIDQLKKRRPASWQTLEVGRNMDKAIGKLPAAPLVCVIDCLSFYVSNILTHDRRDLELLIKLLLQSMEERPDVDFIMVTSEVGSSIVPENALNRLYRDALGELNMKLAKMAGAVWLCCVGLPLRLK